MSTGFLVTTLSGKLKRLNDFMSQQVLKKLYVYISVNKQQENLKNNEWISKKIVDLYSTTFQLFPNLDIRIIFNDLKLQEDRLHRVKDYDIDVIIVPKDYDEGKISNLRRQKKNLPVVYFEDDNEEEEKIPPGSKKYYKNVVLGGTFDRLHTGHKILLTEALFRCSNKITIGVTDGEMLKGKKLWELIEPCAKRIEEVKKFVKEVDSTVECEIMPITDVYGPTKSEENLNLLVVSAETQSGGIKVNEMRKSKNLNELDIHVVDLAHDSQHQNTEEEKISSSNHRLRLLGTYLRKPQPTTALKCKPYLIGFTGGIASGKSSICEYLQTLGAAVIDCDKIAHDLYKPGSKIYLELIKCFGNSILTPTGEINRKELGSIVFSNQEKLKVLNNLMWPAIFKASLDECQRIYQEEKKDIIILEAAVLVRAGWQQNVHEVWATIIPQEEAIRRIMKRNNLSEEEARLRCEAQPTNSEIVEVANVVFCSLWSHDFTRSQVDKAWSAVQKHPICTL